MSQKKIDIILKEFGLSEKETEVYLFLAKHGVIRAGEIAKKTKIDRSVVYRLLGKLQKKGLVETTLESPTRFVGLPFEKVLDIIIKKKEDKALQIRKDRKTLLEDWQRISEPASESELEKFIVVEGIKKIYTKILQMINETKSKFYGILPVSGLVRAEQFGVFDAAYNHHFKSKIRFNFITELNQDNLKAIKLLKPKLKQEIHLRSRHSSAVLLPRIVIKDEKEIFFFTRPKIDSLNKKQGEVCIYTNCVSLVQTFKDIFNNLWNASTDIEKNIAAMETVEFPKVEPFRGQRLPQIPIDLAKRESISGSQELDQEQSLIGQLTDTIELLKEEERDILDCASVIGEEFSLQIMEKISGYKRLNLLKTLIKIEKFELIKSNGEDYRFNNSTVRELIYNKVDPKLRKEYHFLVAREIENKYNDGFEEVLDELAHHYFLSGNVKKSVLFLMKAGEKAWYQKFRENKIQDALKHYSNAIDLMGIDDAYSEERARALERLGEIHAITLQHKLANEFYEKAIASTKNDEIKDRIKRKIRKKRTVERDGVKITYYVYGEGEQTLFFVGLSLQFTPEVLNFSQRYQVVVMDLIEMLDPGTIPATYSMEFFTKSMKTIIEDLGVDNVYLAGAVLGGVLAIHFIAKYPKKVTKAYLAAIPLKGATVEYPERKKAIDQFWVEAFQSPIWGWNQLQKRIIQGSPFRDNPIADEFLKRTSTIARIGNQRISSATHLIYWKIITEVDVTPLLGKIRIPTLILHGEKDIIPMRNVEYLNKNIQGSKLIILKNGCYINLTEAEKVSELIEEFFFN